MRETRENESDGQQEQGNLSLRGLNLDWDRQRTERLLAGVQQRLVLRRRLWRTGGVALAGAVGAAAVMVVALRPPADPARQPSTSPFAAVDGRRVVRLSEGSEIRLDPVNSEVRVTEDAAGRVRVAQLRGAGHYSVVPRAGRAFEVRAGGVTVTVVGTEFVVERRGDSTWVEVERGKVRVAWDQDGGAGAVLAAGEKGLYPPGLAGGEAPAAPASSVAPVRSGPGHGPLGMQSYRSQVAHHDYRAAYAALARDPALAGDTVDELLVAADVARLSDHPAQAIPYLQRILREHERDERAPMAAFTLGRTLAGLGRGRQAMETFARVRALSPRGPLAEDALVREAEAADTVGDSVRATRLAEQYDREFPRGGRRAEIRRHAHLAPGE